MMDFVRGRERPVAWAGLAASLGLGVLGGVGLMTVNVATTAGPAIVPVALHTDQASHPRHLARPSGSTSVVGWASSNWSGYAVTRSTYTAITGSWKVPSVQPSLSSTYSAAWAGIDGFNNNSLIQTGTEQDYYNGSGHYAAWWTTSAQNFVEQPINSPVSPGDSISAAIKKDPASSSWTITLSDSSASPPWTFTKTLTYTGPGASAEWIMEAPTVGGRIATLAHYSSPSTFDPGTANGASPGLLAGDGGELIAGRRHAQVVSIPSQPDSDADGFNISYGSIAPAPPAS